MNNLVVSLRAVGRSAPEYLTVGGRHCRVARRRPEWTDGAAELWISSHSLHAGVIYDERERARRRSRVVWEKTPVCCVVAVRRDAPVEIYRKSKDSKRRNIKFFLLLEYAARFLNEQFKICFFPPLFTYPLLFLFS